MLEFLLPQKNKISYYILIFIILLLAILLINSDKSYLLSWDTFGYYLYLPQTFIQHDLSIQNISHIQELMNQYPISGVFYQATNPTGQAWVIKYTMGLAFLFLPIFISGHIFALILNLPTDGFSAPYNYSMYVGCFIYSIIGLIYLRKVLLIFFDDIIASIVIILTVLATNYMHGVLFTPSMPHNLLFTLHAITFWYSYKWRTEGKIKYIFILGITIGLATLSRPPDILIILIPILWGINSVKNIFKHTFILLKHNLKHLATLFIIIIFFVSFQLIYWKIYTGKFIFDSYQNPGEGFDIFKPHTIDFLFSFRKGWFIYTPIMIFATLGIFQLRKNISYLYIPILFFFIFNLYALSSWTTWWYAESFGQRSMVQSYAIMSIPLGAFVKYIIEKKAFTKYFFLIIFAIILVLNLFQTWQIRKGIIHPSRMTYKYYFKSFFKTEYNPTDTTLLLCYRSTNGVEKIPNESLYNKSLIGHFDFDDKDEFWDSSQYCDSIYVSKNSSFRLDSKCQFSPSVSTQYDCITKKDHAYFKVGVWIYPTEDPIKKPVYLVITTEHNGGNYKYLATSEQSSKMKINEWNYINVEYQTPEVRSINDFITVYVWNTSDQIAFIDDLKVFAFSPK